MKLIFLLFIISCTKVEYKEIPGLNQGQRYSSELRATSRTYSTSIDLLVAFLWPQKIHGPEDKKDLQIVIATSRKLKQLKEEFQDKKLSLNSLYSENDCPCVLEARCSGSETYDDEDKCIEIEDKIINHNQTLAQVYQLVDVIKEGVIKIGGEWIETNQDFPELPLSQFDSKSQTLTLTAFGNEGSSPLQYEFNKPKIKDQADFQTLIFTSDRKNEGGVWRIEVAPSETNSTLLFQGELFWVKEGIERMGFIYWEQVRI